MNIKKSNLGCLSDSIAFQVYCCLQLFSTFLMIQDFKRKNFHFQKEKPLIHWSLVWPLIHWSLLVCHQVSFRQSKSQVSVTMTDNGELQLLPEHLVKRQKGLFRCWACFSPAGSSPDSLALIQPWWVPRNSSECLIKLTLCIYQQFPWQLVMFWSLSLLHPIPQIHLVLSLTNAVIALTMRPAFNTFLYSHNNRCKASSHDTSKQKLGKVNPECILYLIPKSRLPSQYTFASPAL